ncbi:hypothetical protein [Marinobacterium sedimentorum]|uniref:hypothetical protein n=1 Tax=Marinobacterium sedimentorum TaxID=2927804 RepID=UPI0020C6C5D5|nr:hypothetical protein [Marinobacterium sedimentorum]MCP8687328.1 hypothetical protein [Marinobacterium sedimentorum]
MEVFKRAIDQKQIGLNPEPPQGRSVLVAAGAARPAGGGGDAPEGNQSIASWPLGDSQPALRQRLKKLSAGQGVGVSNPYNLRILYNLAFYL